MSGDREHIVKLNADHKGVCKFGRSQVDEDNLGIVRRNVQDIYDAALQEGEQVPSISLGLGNRLITTVPALTVHSRHRESEHLSSRYLAWCYHSD